MARKKVKLEYIANDSARKATFKKRRKGMMKKVRELSTLCDIKACLIVYGQNEPIPEVWPSVPEAMKVLSRLKKMPEMEQSKKMMNQEGFMRQALTKLHDQLRKQDRENRELETTLLMYQGIAGKSFDGAGIEDVTSLAWLIEMKLNQVQKRIAVLREEGMAKNGRDGVPKENMVMEGKEKSPLEAAMEELQRQEWFTEIMNPHDHLACGGVGDMGNQYGEQSNPWLDAYFPLN